jgi:hypothetical protein
MVRRLEADPEEEEKEEGAEEGVEEREKVEGAGEGGAETAEKAGGKKGKGMNKIECCSVFANGRFAMTGGSGEAAKVRVWNLITGKPTKEFSSANGMVSE